MTTLSPSTPQALKGLAAGQLRWALGHALRTFEAVPEDKLDFKPSETANSPRELMVHMLSGNGHVGRVLGIEGEPSEGPTDKASLTSRLKASTEAIATAMENLPDESVDSMVDFFGPMPMQVFLLINFWHISRHAGQIDYVQTIYGDMDDYFIG